MARNYNRWGDQYAFVALSLAQYVPIYIYQFENRSKNFHLRYDFGKSKNKFICGHFNINPVPHYYSILPYNLLSKF